MNRLSVLSANFESIVLNDVLGQANSGKSQIMQEEMWDSTFKENITMNAGTKKMNRYKDKTYISNLTGQNFQ